MGARADGRVAPAEYANIAAVQGTGSASRNLPFVHKAGPSRWKTSPFGQSCSSQVFSEQMVLSGADAQRSSADKVQRQNWAAC
jgi:hypothetical protein